MIKIKKITLPKINMFKFGKKEAYVLGVDIGTCSLKLAGLCIGPAPRLLFYSVTDIPEKDSDTYIQETIKKVLKDNGFSSRDAVLTFSDESVLFRRIELPVMPQKEIPEALKWKAKEVVHYDTANASMDFHILSEVEKEDGTKAIEIMFAVISNEAINDKIRIIKNAGLSAIGINLPSFGIESILQADTKANPAGLVTVIDFGHTRTGVSIFKGKALDFVRIIPLGSGNISDTMQSAPILSEKGEVTLSKAQSEKLKKDLGISYEEVSLENGISSRQILSLMRPVLERLSKEVKRSIDYYIQEYGNAGEMGVYIIGGGSGLKNLDRYLSEELNTTVKPMPIPDFIDVSKAALKSEDAPSLIALVGMAIGYAKHRSLLPREYRAEKVEFLEKVSLRLVSVIMAAILALSFLFTKLSVNDYANRLKSLPFQKTILEQVKGLQVKVAERETIVEAAQKMEVKTDRIMRELSSLIPSNVVLTVLSISASGRAVNMQGMVYGPKASAQPVLTKFMEDIEKSKYFKEAQLTAIQSTADEAGGGTSNFNLSCSLE